MVCGISRQEDSLLTPSAKGLAYSDLLRIASNGRLIGRPDQLRFASSKKGKELERAAFSRNGDSQKHQLRGGDPALMGLPARPFSRHVRTHLFLSQQSFFKLRPQLENPNSLLIFIMYLRLI